VRGIFDVDIPRQARHVQALDDLVSDFRTRFPDAG
jgi:NitT/TauT family transport system ATP-binding protein